MNILCIGGGPGGLFFAISALRHDPAHRVTVVERRPADTTYGWGIAVSTSARDEDDLLHGVHGVDPETARELRASSVEWGGQHVSVQDGPPVHLGGSGYCLARQQLIDVLTARARALGADIRFDTEVADPAVTDEYDLVVLADGAGSRLRRSWADRFGTTEELSPNRHIWLGTSVPLEDFTYAFERTDAGWIWFYGYRYAPAASTVIVECSAQTWAGLGFDTADAGTVMAQLSRIFARHLDGHPLECRPDAQGRSPWETFPTVRNAHWHSGNVVLVGDSAHTAHYSIGSGTKLALQDAAALGSALASCSPADLPAALQAYEDRRRPAVLALQEAAARSAGWFEDVDRHMGFAPLDLAFALRMRRNATDGALPRWSPLYALHRLTQWRIGRALRRTLATRRRAAQRRRTDRTEPGTPAATAPGERFAAGI